MVRTIFDQIRDLSAISSAIDFLAQLYPFLGGPADLRPLLR